MATSSTAQTAQTATPEEILPPSPPSTPPRISFDPPLFLQRRTAVHAILRQLSSSPRFAGKLRSILDVGCGTDCLLLRSLIPCEDEIPLERITGIDFDEGLFHSDVAESVAPGSFAGTGAAEDRWRPLDISLLQGSFEHLTPKTVPRHDIIVSTEVIEHLDPQPLSHFAPVLLGKMKPKICVITTPNRDFNKVFEIPFTPHRSPVAQPVMNNDEKLPNIGSIINSTHNQSKPCLDLDSIVESAIDQPVPRLVSGTSVADTLEVAAFKTDRNVSDTEFMFDDPPSHSVSFQLAPENRVHEDSEKRFWRPGIPYPMRHPDHRFEWTRAEFREWAKTAAELFGYHVVFTGVGSLDCGMSIVGGTGWAIEKSLEDAEDVFLEHGQDSLGSVSVGEKKVLGEGLEDLIGANTKEIGSLPRKARAVFGDCSQIAVFIIKESTEAEWDCVEGFPTIADTTRNLRARAGSRSEGTARPVFPDAWAPLITPDNWFSLPFFTAPDIRLVCHYSYPFLKNEEYPPPYIHMLEMVQETFISFLPALVLEQWQKTPAVLAREERERDAVKEGILYRPEVENMDIDPYDLYEPPTWEVLRAKSKAKNREEEQEISGAKGRIGIMGGMKAEDVKIVRMVLGAREVWDCSYKLQRAFRFHFDVFRRLFAGVGEEGAMGFLGSVRNAEWETIIDTTRGSTNLLDSECHNAEKMVVELRKRELVKMILNPPGTVDIPINDEYSGPDIIFHDGTRNAQDHIPDLVSDNPTHEEAFWDAWENAGGCCSIQHEDPGNEGNDWDGNWYHDDRAPTWQALKLYTVAAWGLSVPKNKQGGKGKGKEGENETCCITPQEVEVHAGLDIGSEDGVLRIGRNGKVAFRGEEQEEAIEWQEGDVPVVITYFKPLRVASDHNNQNNCTEENGNDMQDGSFALNDISTEAESLGWNTGGGVRGGNKKDGRAEGC